MQKKQLTRLNIIHDKSSQQTKHNSNFLNLKKVIYDKSILSPTNIKNRDRMCVLTTCIQDCIRNPS